MPPCGGHPWSLCKVLATAALSLNYFHMSSNSPSGRLYKLVALVVCAGGAIAAFAWFGSPAAGQPAPPIVAAGWVNHVGAPPTLESLRGKWVLLDFWGTFCGPCIREIPQLNEMNGRLGPRGLILLGLSPEPETTVVPFLARLKTPLAYPTGIEAAATFSAYGVSTIPRLFLINPQGKIVWSGRDPESAEAAFNERSAGEVGKPE